MQLYGLPIVEKNTFLHFEKSAAEIPRKQRRQSAPELVYQPSSTPTSSPRRFEKTQSLGSSEFVHERAQNQDARCTGQEEVYTVMIRNIPCSCKKQEIINAIAELGFIELHNFFYVPTRHGKTLGYAFIGFSNAELTDEFTRRMTGYRFLRRKSNKVVEIVPASIQGLDNTWEHFKDTSVMQTPAKPSFPSRD